MHPNSPYAHRPLVRFQSLIAFCSVFVLLTGVIACSDSNQPALAPIEPTEELTSQPTNPTVESTPTPTPSPSPTRVPTPSPTPIPTPTPTIFEQGEIDGITRSPFNGLAVDDETLERRILVIKVDNHEEARPQSGIQLADMMIEVWVEGITRYLAVFQASDTDFVGPIRSMRPTDFALQNSWASTFVNSGGQDWIQAIGDASTARWFIEPPGSFRVSARPRPWNLYGDTNSLRTLDNRGTYSNPLSPLWEFGDMPDDAAVAEDVTLKYWFDYTTSWYWNEEEFHYEKSTVDRYSPSGEVTNQPHYYLDPNNNARRISADTLIMLETIYFLTCYGCESGSNVPVAETVGSGTAWVFHGGKMQKGNWSRSSEREWFTLTLDDGSPMLIPPGQIWMTLSRRDNVIVNQSLD